jgi:methionine-gamma-lyase
LKVRMEQQGLNAGRVAECLNQHSKVEKVYYLGFCEGEQLRIKEEQCIGDGAMVSFDIAGGEREAFIFLNNLKLIKLAVSLGSTESLAEHPATMTHIDIPQVEKDYLNISPKMIRLSIGVENYKDIIWDIEQALEKVPVRQNELA